MEFQLPDGSTLTLPDGSKGLDAATAIGPGLARAALAVKVDGELRDLGRVLPTGDGVAAPRIEILTERSGPEVLGLIRHDCAHVLAEAVSELYPGVKLSIGPPIESGFYYDFDFPDGVSLSDSDLGRIEEKMNEHIAADEQFVRE
ncbi:MAG TPA: TGS domain-containing protein, partial [Solirubrobacteraceae bacterium]